MMKFEIKIIKDGEINKIFGNYFLLNVIFSAIYFMLFFDSKYQTFLNGLMVSIVIPWGYLTLSPRSPYPKSQLGYG